MTELNYTTSQQAWQYLNEKLLLSPLAYTSGNLCCKYDVIVNITKSWIDPEFDFGKNLGYTKNKWRSLVNNYVDMNYLDLVRSEVILAEKAKRRLYSFSYHFTNKHNNGKDCLISLVISRRLDSEIPIVVLHTRATELTKRFLFDLLLVHRIIEYLYGNKTVELKLYLPSIYIQAESFTLYDNINPLMELIPKVGKTKISQLVEKTLDKFKNGDHNNISYDSHKRISLKLKGELTTKSLLAKNLKLK